MVNYGTPIMTKVISNIVQNRQNEISGGQRCIFGARNMTRESIRQSLIFLKSLAKGEKDDMLRGKAVYLFQDGR